MLPEHLLLLLGECHQRKAKHRPQFLVLCEHGPTHVPEGRQPSGKLCFGYYRQYHFKVSERVIVSGAGPMLWSNTEPIKSSLQQPQFGLLR